MQILLIRHAQTKENFLDLAVGWNPGTLTELGKSQSQKLGLFLKDQQFDQFFISDTKRAVDTASEIIKHHPNTSVEYSKDLRERNYGKYEGMQKSEYDKIKNQSTLPWYQFIPEDGESFEQAQIRIVSFFNKLIQSSKHKKIAIIGHGGTLTSLILHIQNKSFENFQDFHPHQTAITTIEVINDKPTIISLNQILHLESHSV